MADAETADEASQPVTSPAKQVIYCGDAVAEKLSSLSVEARAKAEKDSLKKAAKAEAAASREAEKLANSIVYIKRVERSKRKYVTVVSGLELFGYELKKVAKDLGKRFATGSSVTKNAAGTGEEITVQGDVSDDLYDWIEEHLENVPEDNVECIEDKKKKG
ncbi:MAG: Translation machinery-associated protein 22 [Bogoriella megaspora]|nr:MAG: Translation machinery-associated protein 22 [Bogoriella megaspora]